MPTFTCKAGCCTIKYEIYKSDPYLKKNYKWSTSKAGAFIYDPKLKKVLLVQSKGMLWGPPKGTRVYRESYKKCAIREVEEETGIVLRMEDMKNAFKIHNNFVYYYVECSETQVSVQHNDANDANDANAIGWINTNCLNELITDGNIVLTAHAAVLLRRLLGLTFKCPEFTLITRKNKKGTV
jgi:ADP-ribose pyrophosphatase YjhB (NUDIX family)